MSAGSFPIIRIFEWDTAEIASPSGTRHIPGGSFAFKQMVGSGCSNSNPLNVGATSGNIGFSVRFDLTDGQSSSHVASKPTAITFNLAASGTAISDMKLFLTDDSAFQASQDQGMDRAFMQYAPSGSLWRYNLSLPSGSVRRIPTSVPVSANIFRQDGGNALVGQDDSNSSEFVYLNIVVPQGTAAKTYGVCGSGLLRLALVFNYWSNDFILEFGDII